MILSSFFVFPPRRYTIGGGVVLVGFANHLASSGAFAASTRQSGSEHVCNIHDMGNILTGSA